IGASVARELLPHLGSTQSIHRRRARPDPDTYELYRRGKYALTESGDRNSWMRSAISYFSQAVVADSTFAEAYAGLAESYAILATGNVGDFPVPVAIDSARYFAARA